MNYTELLLLLSILPSIILGIMIYKKDVVEKEPTILLVKLFLGGIGAIAITLILSYIIDPILPEIDNLEVTNYIYLAINTFFKVALIEEFSKWIFLKKITWKNKEFNYIYDAIVYAVFISLGFATIENILYVLGDNGGINTAILRAIVSVPGHAFNGVFMGYYYGLSKQSLINNKKNLMKKNMILSLLIPVILHFIFDYLLLSNNNILLTIYILFIMFLYINSFNKINQLSKITVSLYNPTRNYYCVNCGNKINGNFCSFCGHKVKNIER